MTVTTWFVLYCLVPALAFVILYLPRPWWGNPAGRAVMTISVSLLAVLSLILLRYRGVELPDWFNEAAYAAIGTGLWLQLGGYVAVRRGAGSTVDAVPGPKEDHHDRGRQPQG